MNNNGLNRLRGTDINTKLNPNVDRRDFLKWSGLLAAGAVTAACSGVPLTDGESTTGSGGMSSSSPATAVSEIEREKTLILMFGGGGGQFADVGIAGLYAAGTSGHHAVPGSFEPLFFYSAFADEFLPWLCEKFEYNDDFTELVVTVRDGAEWSDGTPFTAEDIRFTIQMLIDNAPLLRNSAEVSDWVASVEAVDDLICTITFNNPRPRFLFSHLTGKFDTGLYWVPAHIYKDVDDVQAFEFYDPAKGWPVVTGPYNVALWTPQQKFLDRRDDWWAAKIGLFDLPEVERIIYIPWTTEERAAQLLINDEIDSSLALLATTIETVVEQGDNIITHTNRELPLGYVDWWPTSFWFNCDEGPFADKNVRWAVSYTIDREQMLDVALQGSGILTKLPFPEYPPLMPYIEAASDLLEKYNTNEHNLTKAAERMATAGYAKDDGGFWAKDGERIDASIHGFSFFNDIGPILAEQLRRGGFVAEYAVPADTYARMSNGTAKIMLFGHGASIVDPFDTLDLFTSKNFAPTGERANPFSRYQNRAFDAIVDEMAMIAPSPDDPEYMALYLSALEIYLEDLIDCPIQQWLHRIPMNETHWTNWPTVDNPYVNGAFWNQTIILLLQGLKAQR